MNRLADYEPYAEPYSWPNRKVPSPAMQRAIAKIEAQAVRTATRAVKERARAYALRPRELDAICEGLSYFSPKAMVWVIKAATSHHPNRWFGFDGEAPIFNLRGAMLYARYSRAIASRNAHR